MQELDVLLILVSERVLLALPPGFEVLTVGLVIHPLLLDHRHLGVDNGPQVGLPLGPVEEELLMSVTLLTDEFAP